ncbi:hypothetical protein Tco_1293745 [Tanacetum coccineum]
MLSPKFAETHNVVAFLEKPKESDGFAEIIDFLKASSVSYALTVNPLQALVDKKRVIVTESSIRRDLHLDDAEGTDCLPTATIFEELACMGWRSQILARAGKDFSRRITPLFDTMMVQPIEEMGKDSDHPTDSTQIHIIDQPSSSSQPKKDKQSKKAQRQEAEVPQDKAKVPQDEAEHEESVPTPSNDPQPSSEDSMQLTDLMILCTKLQTQVLDLQKSKDAQAKEIGRSIEDSNDKDIEDDSSKQGRKLSDAEAQEKAMLTSEEVPIVSTAEVYLSTAGGTVTYTRRSAEKRTRQDKGKAIMIESEPKKKSKKELE